MDGLCLVIHVLQQYDILVYIIYQVSVTNMILLHAQGSSSTHWRWTTIPFYDNPRPPTGMPTIELTRRPPKPMAWNQTQHFGLLDPSKRKFEFRVSSSVVLQIAGDAFARKFKSNLQKKLETDGKFSLVCELVNVRSMGRQTAVRLRSAKERKLHQNASRDKLHDCHKKFHFFYEAFYDIESIA